MSKIPHCIGNTYSEIYFVNRDAKLRTKRVFEFVGRGPDKRVAVNAEAKLSDTDLDLTDKAADVCPVGAILKKRVGYAIPVGQRKYDTRPIGSDIEARRESGAAASGGKNG